MLELDTPLAGLQSRVMAKATLVAYGNDARLKTPPTKVSKALYAEGGYV
ncbi:hypothetical protein [Thalassotalea sp. ND16A]|nr:hypothetical protein [Thalassotalea sp. ND16A]